MALPRMDGWMDVEKGELMREGAEWRCLSTGDASCWVMNGAVDTREHICHRRWMKGVNKSVEKKTQVLHLVVWCHVAALTSL